MGEETPDRYIPDNLDEIMQRVYEHGVVLRKHHIQQDMSEQEYLQTTRDTITSPSIIAELQQHGGPTWLYGRKFGDTEHMESEARIDEDQNAASLRCTIIPIRKRPCRRRQAEYLTVRLWVVASNTLTFLSRCRAKNVARVG